MFKKIAITAALSLGALSFYACDSLLDTEPRQSVSPEVALQNLAGVRGIAASAYNRLLSTAAYTNTRIAAPEVLADNGVQNPSGSPSGRYVQEAQNAIGTGVGGWGTYFAMINDANYIIDGVDALDGPQVDKDRFRGEMLFLRALAYHDLAKSYGYEPGREINNWNLAVTLRVEPTRGTTDADTPRPRNTNLEVYEQIERDLLLAVDLLGSAGGNDRFQATEGAAKALLARVYLYWGRWADAAEWAQEAMDTPGVSLATPAQVPGLFATTDSPGLESFFEVRVTSVDFGGAVNNSLSALFTPAQWFDVVPSVELKALYEEGDARFNSFVDEDGDEQLTGWYSNRQANGNLTQIHSIKFNQTVEGPGSFIDNTPVLRYGEMLITRAEALARNDQFGPALTELNRLRVNRGLGELSGLTGQALIDEIMDERRRELAFEGHRWFDLKRLNQQLNKPAESGFFDLLADDFRWLSPVPTGQVTAANGVIQQNPGYAADDDE
ncbi:MAG: RagB/SusD family nutrient uptake outer membrane protein [Balneolia bacterium]|nr:RagB/SusD family nutrient uptake outer membrane protein [Balneolia bacterium]